MIVTRVLRWILCFILCQFITTQDSDFIDRSRGAGVEDLSLRYDDIINEYSFYRLEHPHSPELLQLVRECSQNALYCEEFQQLQKVNSLAAKITNQHAALLISDHAKTLFQDIFYYLDPQRSSRLSSKVCHILFVLSFALGDLKQAELYKKCLNQSDLVSIRAMVAQSIIYGNETEGFEQLQQYAILLQTGITNVMKQIPIDIRLNSSTDPLTKPSRPHRPVHYLYQPDSSVEEMQEYLLSYLFSETQSGVRTTTKVFDLPLISFNVSSYLNNNRLEDFFTEKVRFRLGIGLSKLGLHELSLRHVGLAAAPWQSLLFRLRAKLIFNPIHSSVGSLALAVNQFERNIESLLLSPLSPAWQQKTDKGISEMSLVCNSPNEAALALQSLPLLHLLGYSSPRIGHSLGHSPVPLSMLLGEVYLKICPLLSTFNQTLYPKRELVGATTPSDIIVPSNPRTQTKVRNKFRLGIVAGTFDGLSGRLMIGLFAGLAEHSQLRKQFEIIALCFPTARSIITDRVMTLFDENVNLSPDNKTQIINRIRQSQIDFLLFMDASLDARVFTLAYERLATFQGLFWSSGGSLQIPTIDYYFIPEIFWTESRCPHRSSHTFAAPSASSSSSSLAYYHHRHVSPQQYPQELYREQIVLLSGIPFLPRLAPIAADELRMTMRAKYLIDLSNRTNLYLLPISIKHLHPEFDKPLEVILRTDPNSMIIIATIRAGRDSLSPTHIAVRHDLMHPPMPMAAVMKLRKRFANLMKDDFIDRIHILPPLDEPVFRALQLQAVAVLDPYPVGLHAPILEAILDAVPIVSLPFLQECTNSHAINLQKAFNISYYVKLQKKLLYFTTAEEYGVLAVQLSKDRKLRQEMIISSETLQKLSFQPPSQSPQSPSNIHYSNNHSSNSQEREKKGGGSGSDAYPLEFTQYYHQHHHFVQILNFILQLKTAFTAET